MTKNLQNYNRITGYSTTIGLLDTVLQLDYRILNHNRTPGFRTTKDYIQ